jgi:large subunit ribosomal protein L17
MKKRKAGRIFSRKPSVRKALLLSVTQALIQKEKIKTTEAKAKEVRPLVEKLVTKGMSNTIASRRNLSRYLSPRMTKKIIEDISPRYSARKGGYTRIVKLNPRKSDGARMAILEFVK